MSLGYGRFKMYGLIAHTKHSKSETERKKNHVKTNTQMRCIDALVRANDRIEQKRFKEEKEKQ